MDLYELGGFIPDEAMHAICVMGDNESACSEWVESLNICKQFTWEQLRKMLDNEGAWLDEELDEMSSFDLAVKAVWLSAWNKFELREETN